MFGVGREGAGSNWGILLFFAMKVVLNNFLIGFVRSNNNYFSVLPARGDAFVWIGYVGTGVADTNAIDESAMCGVGVEGLTWIKWMNRDCFAAGEHLGQHVKKLILNWLIMEGFGSLMHNCQ
jgi:hypothetical protein